MQPDSVRALDRRSPPEPEAISRESAADPEAPAPPTTAGSGDGFRLERRVDGKLWWVRGVDAVAVDVVRCFPWTEPRRFLSLRDAEGEERAFVRDLDDLDARSRAVLAETLRRASFVLDIAEILEVEEDFELRSWSVRAAHGVRRFQTPLDAWPQRLPDESLLLEDVHGDLYRVPPPAALDAKSRKLLWAFVD